MHGMLKLYVFSHTIHQNSYMLQCILDHLQGLFYINLACIKHLSVSQYECKTYFIY